MKTLFALLKVMTVLASGWIGQSGVVSAASLDEAFQSALMAEEGRRDLTED